TGKRMMENAIKQAAATENTIIPLTRYDMNVSNAIIYTIKEQNITDVLIGLHKDSNQKTFLGPITENIISKSRETIYIYKYVQPFNTLKRMLVVVTPKAELEPGFRHWFSRVSTIAKAGGLSVHFYAEERTIEELKKLNLQSSNPVVAIHTPFSRWEDFLILSRELKQNDFLVIISSRKGHFSFQEDLDKLPYYMSRYFTNNSFIILYPKQLEATELPIEREDHFLIDAPVQVVNKAGDLIGRIFKRKKG